MIAMFRSANIGGLPYSGRSTLARRVAEELNWEIYALPSQIPVSSSLKAKKLEEYEDRMWKGDVVADVPYPNNSDPAKSNPTILQVFLTAVLVTRAERLQVDRTNRDLSSGYSLDNTKDILLSRERAEIQKGKSLWGNSYDHRKGSYHLRLHTDSMTVEDEVDAVLHKLGRERRAPAESVNESAPVSDQNRIGRNIGESERRDGMEMFAYHLNNSNGK